MHQNIAIRQTTGQDMPGVMALPREAFGMDAGAKLVRRCRGPRSTAMPVTDGPVG